MRVAEKKTKCQWLAPAVGEFNKPLGMNAEGVTCRGRTSSWAHVLKRLDPGVDISKAARFKPGK
jgi:hypothetical protein